MEKGRVSGSPKYSINQWAHISLDLTGVVNRYAQVCTGMHMNTYIGMQEGLYDLNKYRYAQLNIQGFIRVHKLFR